MGDSLTEAGTVVDSREEKKVSVWQAGRHVGGVTGCGNSDATAGHNNKPTSKKRKTIQRVSAEKSRDWEICKLQVESGRSGRGQTLQQEFEQLQVSLRRAASLIQAPPRKPYQPYLFNHLGPYYDTSTPRFLITLSFQDVIKGYASRQTAQGLTEPWIDLHMDRSPARRHIIKYNHKRQLKSWQSSSVQTQFLANYQRTQTDFYRMQLDKHAKVRPMNREQVGGTHVAFLQNTPRSKAVTTSLPTVK